MQTERPMPKQFTDEILQAIQKLGYGEIRIFVQDGKPTRIRVEDDKKFDYEKALKDEQ